MGAKEKGRYQSLISNTLLFGISTFGSKMLAFFMMPLYTRVFTPEAISVRDLASSACFLLAPVISLCVHEAVIRFGVERDRRKRDVFTTAVLTVCCGFVLLFCFYPLLLKLEDIKDYMHLVYIFTFTSAMRSVVTHFVRAGGFVKLFALDGVVTTVLTVALNIVFLVPLKMGVHGYLLSTILADAFSSLSLILILKLYRFFKVKQLDSSVARQMLAYCIPLMPTSVFWWVTNLSDRYFVAYMVSQEVNGLYGTASTIPRMITLVSSIFIQAWQMSAFDQYKSKGGEKFYSNVFRSYYTLIFLAASGIILLVKPITAIMVSEAFYESWRFVPLLVLAVSFSCFVTFLGTIYNAAKKNAMVTITTLLGAVLNIGLNALLIPKHGANGAAFATFVSYLVVFIIRAVDTRRYVTLKIQPLRILLTLALLLLQCWVALAEVKLWVLWECLIFLLIFACNVGNVIFILRHAKALLPAGRAGKAEA